MTKPHLRLVAATERAPLTVLTVFYANKAATDVTRRIRSSNPLRAMQLCMGHMRRNTYGAVLAEVYDTAAGKSGKLYGVMKRTPDGQVHPLFQLSLKEDKGL